MAAANQGPSCAVFIAGMAKLPAVTVSIPVPVGPLKAGWRSGIGSEYHRFVLGVALSDGASLIRAFDNPGPLERTGGRGEATVTDVKDHSRGFATAENIVIEYSTEDGQGLRRRALCGPSLHCGPASPGKRHELLCRPLHKRLKITAGCTVEGNSPLIKRDLFLAGI